MQPLVSVVIPAFRAQGTVVRAVQSVLAGGLAEAELEVLVESDDGDGYPQVAALSPTVRVGVTGAVGSGVGTTRNRAMTRARGHWLAFVDADDTVAPGWLAALLSQAKGQGAAASALEVVEAGGTILSLWSAQPRLGFSDLAATGASVRMMVARDRCPPFAEALSQDILHAVTVMAAHGGSLPLSPVPYRLSVQPGSVTAADDFSARVHRAYLDHIAGLEASDLPPAMARAAADVFRAKIALNAAYQADGGLRSYYRFIVDRAADGSPSSS